MSTTSSRTEPGSTAPFIARRPCCGPEIRALLGTLALLLVGAAASLAQTYSIDWSTIGGGGGTSTGGVYTVSGIIGQPDAGATSGGNYLLTGGFWSLIAVVQTAGLPNLWIAYSGKSVIISWPNAVSCTLQSNNSLANTSGWSPYGGTVNTVNGTNSVTINPSTGNLFFRLKQ
jgi:hypothetical protein